MKPPNDDQRQVVAANLDPQHTYESSTFDHEKLEGPLQRIVNSLVPENDDENCESLIRLMRLIDSVDDGDKCVITCLIINAAFARTRSYKDSLQGYINNLTNESDSQRRS